MLCRVIPPVPCRVLRSSQSHSIIPARENQWMDACRDQPGQSFPLLLRGAGDHSRKHDGR